MSELSFEERQFMKLVLRSPDTGDGWRKVSKQLTPFVESQTAKRPELYDTVSQGGQVSVRLTDRGQILSEYLP